jgi:hypothetical protein
MVNGNTQPPYVLRIFTIAINSIISPSSYLFATWSTETILSTPKLPCLCMTRKTLQYYSFPNSPIYSVPSSWSPCVPKERSIKQENQRLFFSGSNRGNHSNQRCNREITALLHTINTLTSRTQALTLALAPAPLILYPTLTPPRHPSPPVILPPITPFIPPRTLRTLKIQILPLPLQLLHRTPLPQTPICPLRSLLSSPTCPTSRPTSNSPIIHRTISTRLLRIMPLLQHQSSQTLPQFRVHTRLRTATQTLRPLPHTITPTRVL